MRRTTEWTQLATMSQVQSDACTERVGLTEIDAAAGQRQRGAIPVGNIEHY
jgi:hypothetical protein